MSELQRIAKEARAHANNNPQDIDYHLLADLAEELVRLTSATFEVNPPARTWASGQTPPKGAEDTEGV